jgi:hypothetical protein
MAFPETRTEAEQLKTQVEKLENALERILDALRDGELTDAERVARAAAIAAHAMSVISPRRHSHQIGLSG